MPKPAFKLAAEKIKKFFHSKKGHAPWAVFVFSLVVLGLVLSAYAQRGGSAVVKTSAVLSLQEYADNVLSACAGAGYKPTCYDDEIPKLMDYISMQDAFQVTKLVQDKDPSYAYCHVLGHKLAARETDKDPSKWKEVMTMCPSGVCSNGCVHGAFQERFRKEDLTPQEVEEYKPQFANICEPRDKFNPTGMEQATCYHALGHLLMYVTKADIKKSLSLCDELAKKANADWSQLCYDGTFMQIFQPLETEDFALVKGKTPTAEQLPEFCSAYTGKYRSSCLSESWPLFSAQIKTGKGLVKFCSNTVKLDPAEEDRCYSAMFYVLTAQSGFDGAKLTGFCDELPAKRVGQCYANASSRMIETDYRNIKKASDLCGKAQKGSDKDACFAELLKYSTYNFHPGSAEAMSLCSDLPEPWQGRCVAQQKSFQGR